MYIENPYDLAKISTILASLVTATDWESLIPKKATETIQEVQCLVIEGESRIFITGNKGEHTTILKALNACGVTNIWTLLTLLTTYDQLISLEPGQRQFLMVNTMNPSFKYSTEENKVISGEVFLKNSFVTPSLSIIDAKSTRKTMGETPWLKKRPSKKEQSESDAIPTFTDTNKIWLIQKLFNKEIKSTQRPPLGALSLVSSHASLTQEVNVIENNQNVHAELALLKFFTEGVLKGTFNPNSTVFLGGAKRACKNCKNWINKYREVYVNGIDLRIPENCDRSERQNNEGQCPKLPEETVVREDIFKEADLFRELFSGATINSLWHSG